MCLYHCMVTDLSLDGSCSCVLFLLFVFLLLLFCVFNVVVFIVSNISLTIWRIWIIIFFVVVAKTKNCVTFSVV